MALKTKIPEQVLENSNALTKKLLSDSVTSDISTTIASSKAVKMAYELASGNKTLIATEQEYTLTSDKEANSTFEVPSYIVGKNYIQLWLDGVYCKQSTNGVWVESGTAGQPSTVIKFNLRIPSGSVITVRVWTKPN